MKKYQLMTFSIAFFGVLVLLLLLPFIASASETCYMDTPSGYQGIGGQSRIGPYSSGEQCKSVSLEYFQGYGVCRCTNTSTGYSGYGGTNPFTPLFAPIAEALSQMTSRHLVVCLTPTAAMIPSRNNFSRWNWKRGGWRKSVSSVSLKKENRIH